MATYVVNYPITTTDSNNRAQHRIRMSANDIPAIRLARSGDKGDKRGQTIAVATPLAGTRHWMMTPLPVMPASRMAQTWRSSDSSIR